MDLSKNLVFIASKGAPAIYRAKISQKMPHQLYPKQQTAQWKQHSFISLLETQHLQMPRTNISSTSCSISSAQITDKPLRNTYILTAYMLFPEVFFNTNSKQKSYNVQRLFISAPQQVTGCLQVREQYYTAWTLVPTQQDSLA